MLLNTQHAFITFKRGTEIPERKIRPPCGATCGLKSFSQFSEGERVGIFKRYWSLGDRNARRIQSLNVLMSHEARLESLYKAVSEFATKKAYFDSFAISIRKYDDPQPLINMKICHTSFKFLQRTQI